MAQQLNSGLVDVASYLSAASTRSRYAEARKQIQEAISEKDYWPEGMRHPAEYRKFYMAEDLSFCGFTNESQIAKRKAQGAKRAR